MNKYELTLRQLNHNKPLFEYDLEHPTNDQLLCIQLYDSKKIDDYNEKDLYVMLRNHIALEELVELALPYIGKNVLYQANAYPGDLLEVISQVGENYWRAHREEKEFVIQKVTEAQSKLDIIKYHLRMITQEDL